MSLRSPRRTRRPRPGFARANPISPYTLLLAGLGALAPLFARIGLAAAKPDKAKAGPVRGTALKRRAAVQSR